MLAPFCHMAFCALSLGLLGGSAPLAAAGSPFEFQERSAADWLLGLGHPLAQERQAAHSWLVRSLRAEDWVELVDAAGGGSYAVRRGLARVLADHPRHFALAARLTAQADEAVAQVGAWALQESALAWNSNLVEEPLQLADFPDAWLLEGGREDRLRGNPSDLRPGGLVVALDRLHLYGDAPADLVLDPRLDPRRRMVTTVAPQAEAHQGSWETLLVLLVRQHKVTLEVVGWRPDPVGSNQGESDPQPTAFVRVCARGDTGGGRGSELLARWVRGAAQAADPERRISCANALAQVGWPAAVAWLGQGWIEGQDAYFEALCIGAARGHLAPVLLGEAGVLRLMEQGAAAGTAGGARSWDRSLLAARALRAVPDVLGADVTLGDTLLRDRPVDGEAAQWLRYSAFAGRFRPHPGLAAQALRGLKSEASPALRRAALAAAVSAGARDVGPVARLAEMSVGLKPVGVEAWVRDLELAGVRPAAPAGFEALHTQIRWVGRYAFWWFGVGAQEEADAAALRLVESDGHLQTWVASMAQPLARGRRKEVAVWVQHLIELLPVPGQRLALHLSLLDSPGPFERLEVILAEPGLSAGDLMDLAFLAPIETVGARARGALVGALETEPAPPGLGAALEQAQYNLRGTGAFIQSELFEADLRRKVVRGSHALTERILDDAWARNPVREAGSRIRSLLGDFEELPPR